MRTRIAALCAAIFMFGVTFAQAEDVTLRFPDGSFEVTGPLLGFDGQAYRVDTRFGVLTIDADTVVCSGDCPDAAHVPIVRLAGASALADVLMPALVESFAINLGITTETRQIGTTVATTLIAPDIGPIARFEITSSSTSEAFAGLGASQVDIVLADRPATREETQRIKSIGLGTVTDALRRRLIARRGMRVVVPPQQSAQGITVAELTRVLAGQDTDWSALSAPSGPLSVHLLEDEADQVDARLREIAQIDGQVLGLGPAVSHPDVAALVAALAEDAGALTVTHETLFSARALPVSHGCKVGSASGATAARDGSDPLVVNLWTYTAAPRLPDIARAFLVYATGPLAQPTIDRAGFLDKRPAPITLAQQGDRLARAIGAAQGGAGYDALAAAIDQLGGHIRLSTAFRFRPGTATLDPIAQSSVQSLAAFLDAGRYDGKELLFAGFSDGEGDPDANRSLSEKRAKAVRDAVQDLMATNPDRAELRFVGFGEVMPLACDDTPWGRHVNRRVEVWATP